MTIKVAVVTITCRRCGRVVAQSIPRVAEPDEVEQGPTPCSPAFAQTDGCPDHPPGPPDANHVPGFGFTTWGELPLAWTTRLLDLPGSVVGVVTGDETADAARRAVIRYCRVSAETAAGNPDPHAVGLVRAYEDVADRLERRLADG